MVRNFFEKGCNFNNFTILGVPIINNVKDYWLAKEDQEIEVNCTINAFSPIHITWWFEPCIKNINEWPSCGNSSTVVSI